MGKIKMANITAVILAGGKSQRMKTDKALIQFNGRTLLENQVDLLSSVFDTVFISANTKDYSFVDKPIIEDEFKDIGPIGGIFSVLRNIETEFAFVLSVDIPMINKELILFLISENENADIVMPVFNGKYEPTCAIYSKNCIDVIENQIQKKDYKLLNFINRMNTKFVDINEYLPFYSRNLFANLNTPKDLQNLN